MVVDTSALIAIALREPEWRVLATVIDASDLPMIATVNWVEAGMVMVGKKDDVGALAIVTSLGIEIEGIGRAEAIEARRAFVRYGKGLHPARLNFADCFAYALAKARGVPLLFKGDDFARTDIVPAWRP
ncbi:MAG TPA: type II toxin-antitoxin system VapC family toxin [Beijerinckiaceae bacterium]|nr:type II toxin-antitoxin system VapC family toxin [Beijerinckiaceae bacterium]